jgi:hypothetical protein
MYSEFIDVLRDQIAAAERASSVEAFTQASGLTVDANGKVERPGSPAIDQRKGNPAVDLERGVALAGQEKRLAGMKNKLADMERNKKLLRDEDLKLQRIVDELEVANAEFLRAKDSSDETRKRRAVANMERLRKAKTTCDEDQDMYNGFINALRDQIADAERVGSLN